MSGAAWREHLRTMAGVTDELIDAARHRLSARLRTNQPRCICAYSGYATRDRLHVRGRVLANKTLGGLQDSESLWRNLLDTYRRFETDEVPNVAVTVRFESQEVTTRTNAEGYYEVEIPRVEATDAFWLEAEARCAAETGDVISAIHRILAPGREAEFGVISDLDDTVIETNVISLLTAAKLTFLGNAKTRKPLEGVAVLYQAFQHGRAARPVNPIFYISSSPWNLYDLLCDFLELNEIPTGPIFLRDYGIERTSFISKSGHRDKLERALRIMDEFPELPFVLVGDSGQHDAALYAEAATLRPAQVKAIYIRDVDPATATRRDDDVREHIMTAAQHNVPMILAPDSRAISRHATELGLIPAHTKDDVELEVAKDQARAKQPL